MTGAGGDKLARQDMFPTKVESWKWEQRIGSEPIGDGSGFDVKSPIASHISELQKIIAANPALRSGTQQTLFAEGQLFAVSRYADKQEYVVAFNTNDNQKSAPLKPVTTGTTWDLLAGSCELSPTAEIKVPGNGFCVMKSRQAIGKSQTTKITAPKIGDSNDAPLWRQVSVTVNKPGYNSVTFLAREKGGKWKSLGTADRTTFATDVTAGNLYRTFLHSELFKKKAPLEVIAVLKNSDGKIISSAITKAINN
jgi:hypothetical protein